MIRPSAFSRRPAPRGLHRLALRVLVWLYGPTVGPEPMTDHDATGCRDRRGLTPCR